MPPSASLAKPFCFGATILQRAIPRFQPNPLHAIHRRYLSAHTESRPRSRLSAGVVLAVTASALAATAGIWYKDDARFAFHTMVRCGRVAAVGARAAVDYKLTLRKLPEPPETAPAEEMEDYLNEKSDLHRRNAERVLECMKKNGGVYIKLGQHVAALAYLLPPEWCETMRELQDRCPRTPDEELDALFRQDVGLSLDEVFEEFDLEPIGVASLAQVHRARLRDGGREVAVKIQHYNLDEYARIDINATAMTIKAIKWAFPDFTFDWLAEEMEHNLPRELDFVNEAQNAERTRKNFKYRSHLQSGRILHIPEVYWAKKRILCMEYIDGGRVDDLGYLNAHGIDAEKVSTELTKVFSEMIFIHGWVHCDPHPGNVMVRPKTPTKRAPHNFELVLLDHGLYRELSDRFRQAYAYLWRSIISGKEQEMKRWAMEVGGTDAHRLLSCILTGRAWEVVSGGLSQRRTEEEKARIHRQAGRYIVQVADLLANVPRELLLLFKTNDLLRSIDDSLQITHSGAHTFIIMGRYCSAAIVEEESKKFSNLLQTQGFSLRRIADFAIICASHWWTDLTLSVAYRVDGWMGKVRSWWRQFGMGIWDIVSKGKARKVQEEERRRLLTVKDFL